MSEVPLATTKFMKIISKLLTLDGGPLVGSLDVPISHSHCLVKLGTEKGGKRADKRKSHSKGGTNIPVFSN